MNSILSKEQLIIKDSLAKALIQFSNNQLSIDILEEIAIKVARDINFQNKVLMHKGINWLAKDILNYLKL